MDHVTTDIRHIAVKISYTVVNVFLLMKAHMQVNMNYRLLLIPESNMCGLPSFCIILFTFEFMWSQAPSTVLEFGYTFFGLSALLHIQL